MEWPALAKPTNWLTQKYGDVILTDEGKPGWYARLQQGTAPYVIGPKVRYGSLNQATIIEVSTAQGSVTAKIMGNVKFSDNIIGDYRWLPVGMNVVIAGAGANGADLNGRIVANDGINLTLDTPAGSSLTAANVTCQPLILS